MRCCSGKRCLVPPAPEVMQNLRRDYLGSGVAKKITFAEYLNVVGFRDPSAGLNGMDDGFLLRPGRSGPELFSIPHSRVTGQLEIVVLLVDFPDLPGSRPAEQFESLLFEAGRLPSGSLLDYYSEVSRGQVSISGSVHGWLRLPRPLSYYARGASGTSPTYPENAQGMAEDAIKVAMAQGVPFPESLDKLEQGIITALFIVHAGRGAEVLPPAIAGNSIWSHKWTLQRPVRVGEKLTAAVYLTVPEDCELGVCAHELGHLAFQWEDFYDANYREDGDYWDGSGDWDLMASGSYNGNNRTPAYPVGLHRMQHGWVQSDTIFLQPGTTRAIELPTDKVVLVRSPAYTPGQYLLLENRQQRGFDSQLPGHGLLVWRVDEAHINTTSTTPGLMLLEADGNGTLLNAGDYNQGDPGDAFPGPAGIQRLSDTGRMSTSFPGSSRSGVTLENIEETETGLLELELHSA